MSLEPSPRRLRLAPMKPGAELPVGLRNLGELKDADVVGFGGSDCGDHTYLYFKFESDGGDRVIDARHATVGCGVTLAAGSAVTEWIKGKNLAELGRLNEEEIRRMISGTEVRPEKEHCIEMVLEAARDAVGRAGHSQPG